MKEQVKGKVVILDNNIDTDQIYPGRYLEIVDPKEIGIHCLEGVDPKIAKSFEEGGIILAGTNFGCGSSREHAAIALNSMGASLVIAESFARIFFRNAINLGLPLIICKGLKEQVLDEDILEVDIREGTIIIQRTGEILQGEKIGDHALKILAAGGIKNMMRSGQSIV